LRQQQEDIGNRWIIGFQSPLEDLQRQKHVRLTRTPAPGDRNAQQRVGKFLALGSKAAFHSLQQFARQRHGCVELADLRELSDLPSRTISSSDES